MTLQYNLPSNAPSNLKIQVFDARKLLPTNPKYTWESLKGLRDLSKVTTIACHHTGMLKAVSAPYGDIEFMQRIANAHINSKKNIPGGDPGFPYHLYVRNGIVYVCNDLEAFTYGVASNNSYTVHISVEGDYAHGDTLDDRDRTALYAAIIMVKSLVPSIAAIKGHKELPDQDTDCPGYSMEQVRNDIKDIETQMGVTDQVEQSQAKQDEVAYRIANEILWTYNLARGKDANGGQATAEQVEWGKRRLLQLEPEMRRLGFLQK